MSSGASIPIFGLGVWEIPQKTVPSIVKKALDTGYRHFDSAQAYENEQQTSAAIGEWLRDHPEVKRSDIFYTTKVHHSSHAYDDAVKIINQSYNYVEDAGLGYIDLMLVHTPLSGSQKRTEAYKAIQEAVNDGKVKTIGVSNYGVHHLKELFAWDGLKYKPAVNQIELHPFLIKQDIIDFCTQNNMVIEAYSPLTRGTILGKDSILTQLAKKYNASEAQVLIYWSLNKGFVSIPKTSKEERVVENYKALDLDISNDDIEKLSRPEAQHFSQGPEWNPTEFKE